MKLYLVRHGEAVSKAKDPSRPLTQRGRDDAARVAAFAQRAGVEVHQVRHSGKRRAEETAEILAEYLKPAGGVFALQGLAPRDDVRPVAELLQRETMPSVLVGHLPFMDRLVGLLAAGHTGRCVLHFQVGSLACLERNRTSSKWSIAWFITPTLLPHAVSPEAS